MTQNENEVIHTDAASELAQLRRENEALRTQLEQLRLSQASTPISNGMHALDPADTASCPLNSSKPWDGVGHGLTKEQIGRYSRQIILPAFGVQAQARLCNGSILVIGAGGLGSPALLYLAAAGVGRIGIVDKDSVELSNIHRQVIHTEATVGVHKALSAAAACKAINSSISIEPHLNGFTPRNAVDLVSKYDVVIDASDNAPTRYLISDACAAVRRPLVSGAAIGTDGQLTVYCHGEDGPCYRCLFPVAPLPQSCARCVDAGVMGVVPGVIGTLQAVEAIKVLAGLGEPMSRKLLIMDSLSARFHVVKLRQKVPTCVACGDAPEITKESLAAYDYAAFTGQAAANDGAPPPLQLLEKEQRISPKDLHTIINQSSDNEKAKPVVVVDVRPLEQFNICHLPDALHAPYSKFDHHVDKIRDHLRDSSQSSSTTDITDSNGVESEETIQFYVVCRRGNDSQRAVARLRELGMRGCVDVVGGMEAWAREVDPEFPIY